MSAFNGVKVFAATMWQQRAALGDEVERWLETMRQKPGFEVVDIVVRQSSDAAFHCLTIVVMFYEPYAQAMQKGSRDDDREPISPPRRIR